MYHPEWLTAAGPQTGHFSNKDNQNELIAQIKSAYNPELKENLPVLKNAREPIRYFEKQ